MDRNSFVSVGKCILFNMVQIDFIVLCTHREALDLAGRKFLIKIHLCLNSVVSTIPVSGAIVNAESNIANCHGVCLTMNVMSV